MSESSGKRKVLILGAGYVSAPVVDYLTRDNTIAVTAAAQLKDEIDVLASKFPNTTPCLLEIHRGQEELEQLVQSHDVVVSLLPYALHPEIAKHCIKYKKNMVTASYRSPGMMELHQAAVDAGITVMNEVGVDPGIDHLLAVECFDEAREHGAKITSFISWCGGLPAPEHSENPLRYKFSWSPLGVLKNVLSGATFLEQGKVVDIGPDGALLKSVQEFDFLPGFNLEGFPNRDSCAYADLYGIQTAHTIIRGTLRYKGFSEAMTGLLKIGLIDLEEHPLLHPGGPDITWYEFICDLLGQKRDILRASVMDVLYEALDCDANRVACLEQLGLLEGELIDKRGNPLETLSNYLSKRLAYGPGEKDLLIMHHEVGLQWPDQSLEKRNIDFVVYGDPKGYSAMAATVGYPTGIATKMVLEGEIQAKGMVLPFTRDIYRPMLKRLAQEGLEAVETSVKYN